MHDIDVLLYVVAVLVFFAAAVVSVITKNHIAALIAIGLFCITLVPLIALTQS